MGKRREARIIAMNALYQMEVGKQELKTALNCALEETTDEGVKKFVIENVEGCWSQLDHIDKLLKSLLKKWQMERVQRVEKTILRLALYELFYRPDIPASAAINEAVELAKQFGDSDSSKFVNGILGAAFKLRQELK